jgi:hypothetical protein
LFEDERGDLCYWFGSDNLERLVTLRWIHDMNLFKSGRFEDRGKCEENIRTDTTCRIGACESY